MSKSTPSDLRTQSTAVAERLADKSFGVPKAFLPHTKVFLAIFSKTEAAAVATDVALAARDEALASIGELDDSLDASVEEYGDVLVGAGLGPRANPFKPFSKYTVSRLKTLPYAEEPGEVRKLVAAVNKKSPPANVTKAGGACVARAAAVDKALKAYTKPAAAYAKALATRDALLPELQKGLKTLRVHAGAAYIDDPGALKALFGKAAAVQAPKKRRAKRGAAEGTPAPAKPA